MAPSDKRRRASSPDSDLMLATSPTRCLLALTAAVCGLMPTMLRGDTHITNAETATKALPADLVRVQQYQFSEEMDVNYDGWPDRWTRVYDEQHPSYVRIRISPIEEAAGITGNCLLMQPDGAAAEVASPPIRVMPKFSYKLRLRVRVAGAEHGKARIGLAFHNKDNEIKQLELTSPLRSDNKWREIELGDFQPKDPEVDRLYVQVMYERGERGDLTAEVAIADIRLYRLPSIRIDTGSPYNVYTDPTDVKVTCRLSGILEQNPVIRFQLLDATNKSIADGGKLEFEGTVISESQARASDIVDGYGSDKSSYEGEIDWHPPITDYGFYRVRVGMFSEQTGLPIGEARAITLAVVRPGLETSERGEFGWTLPKADEPLSFPILQELLPRVGVRLVKLPVWFPEGDEERGDTLMRFAEQLAARGIETIGVLEDPSPKIADPLGNHESPPIESLLSVDPSFWTPMIDHVITRLSLRIRWWQLGADGDTSFVGYRNLVDHLLDVTTQMFRFGQDVRVGIGWRWDHLQDWKKPITWDFEQMAGREQLDAAGLASALDQAPPTTAKRWVLVAPPEVSLDVPEGADPDDPDDPLLRRTLVRRHQQRVRDFVEQILVAKMNGVEGIFIANPFSGSVNIEDARTGVMNEDGTPGELLLPWRTCARLLGGAEYLGSIRLPNASSNWLFLRPDGQVVMVLWNLGADSDEANAAPIEEVLYLGENVREIGIWGDETPAKTRSGRQVIHVGRMPRFVMGLNESVARWRMATRFETPSLSSVFGVAQPNVVHFRNTFPQGVGGFAELFVSGRGETTAAHGTESTDAWNIEIEDPRFSLPAGSRGRIPFSVMLDDASFGDQHARIDFAVTADNDYRFSVWQELRVGLDDISLEVETFLGEDGRLIVEQQMRKESGPPTDFKCFLYAPERRRKRNQVFQLGAEVDKKRYTFLDTDGLLGEELRLRVEEINGSRVLIHRFRVDPKPLPREGASDDARAGSA
ncbi:MAG: hypothetical protein AAF266_00230 [Planctomycetota bacterium]